MSTRLPIVVGSVCLAAGLALESCSRPIGEERTDSGSQGSVDLVVEQSEPDAEVQAKKRGMYFGGEFVAFAEHDPDGPELDLIEACEEIPDEVFVAAGFDLTTKSQRNSDGNALCFIDFVDVPSTGFYSVLISNTGLIEPMSLETGKLNRSIPEISEAVFQGTGHKEQGLCTVAVDTARGYFAVGMNDFSDGTTFEHRCDLAEKVFKTFYDQLGVRQ